RLRIQLAPETETIGVLARDAVLLRDHLGALELARELVVVAVDFRQRAAALAVRAEGHARPHLAAPPGHPLLAAPPAAAGGKRPALLARAALAVDGGRRDLERQPLRQPCRAGNVERLLAHLRHAAGDDLADGGGIDAGALDRGLLDDPEQLGGM